MSDTPDEDGAEPPRDVALALQGGGSHGAFTWGALDRLLEEAESGRMRFAALSGGSAGAINAVLVATGLALSGPEAARAKLRTFWRSVSQEGSLRGNALFGFGEPGPFGWNIDRSPVAIALEAVRLVVSPYTNPFYSDALRPLLEAALTPADLARLNATATPPVFVSATNVRTNARKVFTQPAITIDTLRASSCLPTEFRGVWIDGVEFWDGGYLGNPPLRPLVDVAQDLLLILVNPLVRHDAAPRSARQILDRLNEITFNASVVLEANAIEAVNRVLAELAPPKRGTRPPTRYKPVRFHLIRDDAFMETLGFVSKSSTSWALIDRLFRAGRRAAERWLAAHRHRIGHESSCDPRSQLLGPVLQEGAEPAVSRGAEADDGVTPSN
jgi:NTE family protein